ncbi:potassium-transporting ATPase subunit KdpC [Algoriphagus terrigena]|uniref:potassium-transporting ATPase subunit KdpC n=1 Tax=Algoriphagus terrigena TaxID=344884 RepID=UPI00040D14B2|nr:potassium-transporting ATPase subunit KdpC [Algoriphagus terrigena]
MKSLRTVLGLGLCTLVLFGILYPLAMVGIGKVMPERSAGNPIFREGTLVGFEQIGQSFTSPEYFWGRPSAVEYNAASTGGSNFGPTNPEFLALVQERIDAFLSSNPGLTAADLPIELITASGSGLDPHITRQGALIQASRVANARGVSEEALQKLIDTHTEKALFGMFGPSDQVNVLKLNLAVDELTASN